MRPTWFFGGRDVVTNNIAWVVRHMPVIVVPGDGRYLVTPVVHAPPAAVAVLSHALGVVVRDIVLTADEIRGLTAGLLASHEPALGRVSFLEWPQANASTLGRAYANELEQHFRVRR